MAISRKFSVTLRMEECLSRMLLRGYRCHGDLVPPIKCYPGVSNHQAAYNVHGEMVPPGEMVALYNPTI